MQNDEWGREGKGRFGVRAGQREEKGQRGPCSAPVIF